MFLLWDNDSKESLLSMSTLGTIGTPKIIFFGKKSKWHLTPPFQHFGIVHSPRVSIVVCFLPSISIPLATGLAIRVLLHSRSWRNDWNGWCFNVSNFQYYDPFEFVENISSNTIDFSQHVNFPAIWFNSIQFSQRLFGKNVCSATEVCFWIFFPSLSAFHQQCDSNAKVFQEFFTFIASSMASVTLKSKKRTQINWKGPRSKKNPALCTD